MLVSAGEDASVKGWDVRALKTGSEPASSKPSSLFFFSRLLVCERRKIREILNALWMAGQTKLVDSASASREFLQDGIA